LVLHHLALSDAAFKRDLQDPQTISDVVTLVQSPERLKLLLVLTVADIRGVGPKTWNNWKATLLRELYWLTDERITGPLNPEAPSYVERRVAAQTEALRSELKDWSETDFEAHVAKGTPSYWLSVDAATAARHARLIRRAWVDGAPLSVETRVDPP